MNLKQVRRGIDCEAGRQGSIEGDRKEGRGDRREIVRQGGREAGSEIAWDEGRSWKRLR